MKHDPLSVLDNPRAASVLRRLHAEADKQSLGLNLHYLPKLPAFLFGWKLGLSESDVHGYYADKFIALEREQATFCFQLARALRAKVVVEFGTSFGISTIWLASAVQPWGGHVIGTELLPEKAARAKRNFEDAGVAGTIDLRVGNALETLRDLPDPVDMALIDGFPMLALDIVKLLRPALRPGAVVVTDNVGVFRAEFREYLGWLRDPDNGFTSTLVPFRSGTELSVWRGEP